MFVSKFDNENGGAVVKGWQSFSGTSQLMDWNHCCPVVACTDPVAQVRAAGCLHDRFYLFCDGFAVDG
jgi:hypothetical protein